MYYQNSAKREGDEDETDSAYYYSIRTHITEEIIDFESWRTFVFSLFLGNTGAGKNNIFDAICYVIMVEASGEERSDNEHCFEVNLLMIMFIQGLN